LLSSSAINGRWKVSVEKHLLVREFMGANFVTLEQINCIGLGINMEVPYSEDLASQT
jgi:hypothetical protein